MDYFRKYILGNVVEDIEINMDTITLHFKDKSTLSLYNKIVFSNELSLYKNLIIDDIKYIENEKLKIIFNDASDVEMSLKDSDYESPEAYQLVSFDGVIVVN